MDKKQTQLLHNQKFSNLFSWIYGSLKSRQFIWVFLLFAFLTHIPTGKSVLQSDDFTIWAALTTPQSLTEKGLPIADPSNDFPTRISNAFMFLSAERQQTSALKGYGAAPWWVPDDATMHMFRPLTAITHWLDYQYLDLDVFWMQLHSVFYMLLLAVSYYCFCYWFGAKRSVAAIAVVLFVFSYSMPQNLSWLAARNALIAPIFAIWAVLFHHFWRSRSEYGFLLLSMLALLLALLAAEAGIAALAYLGAYMLLLDKQPFWRRVWTLLPALIVVVLWRVAYSYQGFGAENISLYVDPVRSPVSFISERLLWMPIYYAKILLGPLASIFVNLTSSILWLSFISIVICGSVLWFLSRPIRRDRLIQFALLGSWVSIIPFLASSPGARTEPFLHLGFMLFLASWLDAVLKEQPSNWPLKLLIGFILTLHLLIPGLATIARHWRLVTLEAIQVDAYSSIATELKTESADLVIVNPPDYFAYYHRPLSWAWYKKPLPKRMHLLVPGLTEMAIERIDSQRYRISSMEGFALAGNTPTQLDQRDDPNHNRKRVLHYRANNQIMISNKRHFSTTEKFQRSGFSVTVTKLRKKETLSDAKQPMPTELVVEFTDSSPKVWQWYDWQDHHYKKFEQLAIGEKRKLLGPFSVIK